MCNSEIISVCLSSTVLTVFLFYSSCHCCSPAWVTSRLHFLHPTHFLTCPPLAVVTLSWENSYTTFALSSRKTFGRQVGEVWSKIPKSECRSFLWVQWALDCALMEWKLGRRMCRVAAAKVREKDFSKPMVAGKAWAECTRPSTGRNREVSTGAQKNTGNDSSSLSELWACSVN